MFLPLPGGCSSAVQSCMPLCNSMDSSMPGILSFTISQSLLTHVHWAGDAIQPSWPLSYPFSSAFNLSQHRVFSNESALCIRWPKYWSFCFNFSPSNEYSWLISFRINWLDLLAVLGTLKSLLQHHSSKALILRHSAFFMYLFLKFIYSNWTLITLQY